MYMHRIVIIPQVIKLTSRLLWLRGVGERGGGGGGGSRKSSKNQVKKFHSILRYAESLWRFTEVGVGGEGGAGVWGEVGKAISH